MDEWMSKLTGTAPYVCAGLPQVSGVYVFVYKGIVMYIGKAERRLKLNGRISEHSGPHESKSTLANKRARDIGCSLDEARKWVLSLDLGCVSIPNNEDIRSFEKYAQGLLRPRYS